MSDNPIHIYNDLLLGKTLDVARSVAMKRHFYLEVQELDGVEQCVKASKSLLPVMYVAVADGVVSRLISFQ